ncbi:major facilitator superfamily transporter [Colletotrichum musicola]|uniref:Major facilitator superfamily transporter n=1 Tax=Colletotrichum musicola TaxID=2175873 RepID=A0A8H6JM50_9PEZI|nr:major facilitator superfamily transporter [Colletotrichum musicola]
MEKLENSTPNEAGDHHASLSIKGELPSQETRDWNDAEERKVKLKLDAVLVTTLMLGFFALQLDKTNISSAITTDFTKDIGITNNIVNSGNQLSLAAIVIFEIPSNMILSRLGAPLWLTIECFSWGMVATFQAFITNKSSFYATRFLLGTFEAGYLAGSLVVIGMFYTKTEVAVRMTVLYTANYLAAGTSTLIAAGVFKMDRVGSLHDWQWLFIIDGAFTVLVAFVILLFLPKNPGWTRPLVGIPAFDMFSERERHIMSRRIHLEDQARSEELTTISLRDALRSLCSNYYIWLHSLVALISLTPKGGLLLYAPTIIKNLGFDKINANLLASVSNYALIILSLAAARMSDWLQLRGPVCMVCTIYALVFAGVQYSLVLSDSKWGKYAVFVLFMAGNATFQGVNSAWLSSNVKDPKTLAVGQALIVMAANLGGLAGQQLFRDEDAPRYTRGFLGIIGLYAGTLVLVAGLTVLYWLKSRRMSRLGDNEGGGTRRRPEDVQFQI